MGQSVAGAGVFGGVNQCRNLLLEVIDGGGQILQQGFLFGERTHAGGFGGGQGMGDFAW